MSKPQSTGELIMDFSAVKPTQFSAFIALTRRELGHYFLTPIAYIFLAIFLLFSGVCTFYLGQLYETGQADLQPFFVYHPWLYLFLVPALSMRLWAEERKVGTIELLLTLPVQLHTLILSKFIASWLFIGAALALTTPVWLTVSYLGEPDHGVVWASYFGSWLMAGGFLAVGGFTSALSKNQVVAFVMSLSVCFVFVAAGFPLVIEWAAQILPRALVDLVAGLSFFTHYLAITKGVLDLRDLAYFVIVILSFLTATGVVIQSNR